MFLVSDTPRRGAGGLRISITNRTLKFKQPARTSRGEYTTRLSRYVDVCTDGGIHGVGECATLPDLSCDEVAGYDSILRQFCDMIERTGRIPYDMMRPYPSILFGLETAFAQIDACGSFALFDTPFARGEAGIPTNGLVWMGDYDQMLERMQRKLDDGFRCIKIKIGAIGFDREVELLSILRSAFPQSAVELRLDANGAFDPDEAMALLDILAHYDIHSIEQPIRQRQWRDMARLCASSPIPIALDEELIGVNMRPMKEMLLDTIRPQYIVLKPSLHGGMAGTAEWVSLARERGIGSWMTSALESNVGLNAIAHLAAKTYPGTDIMPQGLGTGQLFTENVEMPIELRGERMWFKPINYGN